MSSSILQAVSRGVFAATGFIGALSGGAVALAQDTAASTSGTVDDVIVTATRRAQSISKVPAAISAISQAALDNVGASSILYAVTATPNLHTTVSNDVSIRGVGSNLFAPSAGGTPVAIHVDGIYTNDRAILTRSAFDLERIEVLRGPQGTLYGRNATGGVLNLITAAPDSAFAAYGDASISNGRDVTLRGVLNVPATRNLAFRLAGFAESGDGFQQSATPGQSDGDASDFVSARLSAHWSPLDWLSWNASLSYGRDRAIAGIAQYAYFLDHNGEARPTQLSADETPPLPPSHGPLAFGDNVTDNFADRNRAHLDVVSATSRLRAALSDTISLTYLAGYNHLADEGSTNAIPFIHRINAATTQENSHELSINYEGARWHGVAGIYHFAEITGGANLIHIWIPNGQDQPALTPGVDQINQYARSVNNTEAVFGQATLSLTDDLRLTLGARYTRDKIETGADTQSYCPFGAATSPFQNGFEVPLFGGATTCGAQNIPTFSRVTEIPPVTAEFGRPNYLGTIEYDITPNVLAYATAATGYRTGGVSETSPAIVLYAPETNTNFEAGVRARLFRNSVNLNLTAFRETYRDMQIQLLAIPTSHTINAAEATIDGVEAEYFLAFSPNDRLSGYVTWLDATFDSFPTAFSAFRNTVTDAAGHDLAQTPNWSAYISYAHVFELGALGRITPTVQNYWQDVSFAWYTNNIEDKIPVFFRSDLVLAYETPSGRVSLDAFVNNIEDHRTIGSIFPAIGVGRMQWNLYSRGRLAGMRLGVHF